MLMLCFVQVPERACINYITKTTFSEIVEDHEHFKDNEREVASTVVAIFMLLYDDEL